jgi:hypothetical protein
MTYKQRKEALGIRSAPKSDKWSFAPHDYTGQVRPEPDYWERVGTSAPKPPIAEDLSRFASSDERVATAKAYWAKLTPAQRRKQVMLRRRNARIGVEKRKKTLPK